MKLLFLEPFAGESHLQVARGFARHSRHQVDLVTMPDRFWKWRMRGAALHFAQRVDPRPYDAIIASDMMGIADLKALWSGRCGPIICYNHETQLSYPAPQESEADLHFGFTNITSCLAADEVWFNSAFHRDSFLAGLPGFLRRMPDHRPSWVIDAIASRSRVVYPGIDPPANTSAGGVRGDSHSAPVILWNHRWEFDKQPELFFRAIDELAERGLDFQLAVLGESSQVRPTVFEDARERHANRILHWGYIEDRADYQRILLRADLVVSCAIQENFGISVMEAVAAGAVPVLPNRLAYPELFPPQRFPGTCYHTDADLPDAIARALVQVAAARTQGGEGLAAALREHALAFAWDQRVSEWDAGVERLI